MLVEPYYVFWQDTFIRLMAATYFCAFLSLYVQILGLIGSRGIMPVSQLLDWIRTRIRGGSLYLQVPTVFWLNSSDRALRVAAIVGMAASLLIVLGAPAAPLLFVTWAAYLSFRTVGVEFLSFQWDSLLLEVGFLAIFFAIQTPPPPLFVYLMWFLLFRFMLLSGLVKFVWGSGEWRDLTAMRYHYETQPIPNRVAYYMHQLPDLFGKLTVIMVFVWEMILPFFIFAPSSVRVVVFVLMVLFQVILFLTGNFAFFNILSAVICLPLLMDVNPGAFFSGWAAEPVIQTNMVLNGFLTLFAAVLLMMNVAEFLIAAIRHPRLSRALSPLTFGKYLAPYNIVNGYGLFSHMTTKRYEIEIEGSRDGQNWIAYEFKWKPGDLKRAPPQVAPHQPRLDWQMWFAALGRYEHSSWLTNFLARLLEGAPEATQLLAANPFPTDPPKFIRCQLYLYHFSDLETKRKTGQWWTRKHVGMFSPMLHR